MWTRVEIKEKAKRILSTNYWQAFLVSLVLALTGASGTGTGNAGRAGGSGSSPSLVERGLIDEKTALILAYVVAGLIIVRIVIGYVLEVGGRKYFVNAAEGDVNFDYLGFGFREGRYLKILFTMVLRAIYVFLWSLLFVIPGIIKTYAYRMVPYILADNPAIGYNRAIELSNNMTKGQKFDIFILDLSFFGWYILGTLALVVGIFFVQPYYDATNAELYLKIRENALRNGLTTAEELNLR